MAYANDSRHLTNNNGNACEQVDLINAIFTSIDEAARIQVVGHVWKVQLPPVQSAGVGKAGFGAQRKKSEKNWGGGEAEGAIEGEGVPGSKVGKGAGGGGRSECGQREEKSGKGDV